MGKGMLRCQLYSGGYPYKIVGINVKRKEIYNGILPEDVNIIEVYCRLYQHLTGKGYEVRFFTNGVATDYNTLDEIIEKLELDEKSIVRPMSNSGKHFLELLGKFDFIISSRLHTSICCYSMGIPTVALPWDEKFLEFYRESGQHGRCLDFCMEQPIETILAKTEQFLNQKYIVNNYDIYRNTVIKGLEFVNRMSQNNLDR